jgi:molybdopterin molybdotransferase
MRGFRDRADVEHVWRTLEERLRPLPRETITLDDVFGRVLAVDVVSDIPVPSFDRAAMDGYALRAAETYGAGTYNPLEFDIVGEAYPGRACSVPILAGQATRIMTGAPIPQGADAVVPAESTEETDRRVRVCEAVSPGKNVGRRGEDIEEGTVVLSAGRILRPQDLGVLASIGCAHVSVWRRPDVEIVITGDELLPRGSRPEQFRIVDSNSIMLEALVRRDGGKARPPQIVPDSRAGIESVVLRSDADVLLISGGSSVGLEDHAPCVVADHGELSFHGMALRPASPAGVGFLHGRPVFLLPGNPVSCLCAYDFFAGRALRRLGGRSPDWPYRRERLPLARKIASAVGRVDYVRVLVREGAVEPLATTGAAILSSTTRADGFVIVSRDSEGRAAGEQVEVFLYDDVR